MLFVDIAANDDHVHDGEDFGLQIIIAFDGLVIFEDPPDVT